MTYAEALQALDALYAQLPRVACQRLCQASCGVIVMTRLEWVRIQRRLGYKPKGKPTLACPMLKKGACSVHAIRPTICRLFGVMDEPRMRCPHGCQPERWMSADEGYAWLERVEALSQEVFPHSEATAAAYGVPLPQIAAYIEQARQQGTIRYEPSHRREGRP